MENNFNEIVLDQKNASKKRYFIEDLSDVDSSVDPNIWLYWNEIRGDSFSETNLSNLFNSIDCNGFQLNNILSIQFATEKIGYDRSLIKDYKTHNFKLSSKKYEFFLEDGTINIYEEILVEPILNDAEIKRTSKKQFSDNFSEFNYLSEELSSFLKSMRPRGYFGVSPQKQSDLDLQQDMIDKLNDIDEFVRFHYKQNKEIIG